MIDNLPKNEEEMREVCLVCVPLPGLTLQGKQEPL